MEPPSLADAVPALDGNQIVVWPVRIEPLPEIAAVLEPWLSADERTRAHRYQFPHLRHSFVIARGMLRLLLGQYLGLPPAGIHFEYGPHGKPALSQPAPVVFNASHSGSVAVFAFTRGGDVGVDVEAIRPIGDMAGIAKRYFCPDEAAELLQLPATVRDQAFFLCWTRKEAYIKATGEGLTTLLDSFRVTLKPGEPARLSRLLGRDQGAWALRNLEVAPGYAAALAYRGSERPVELRSLRGAPEFLGSGR